MADPKDKKSINLPENVPVDYNFERMLKSFMKLIDKSGILQEVKTRRYYVKPSELRRLNQKKKKNNERAN